MKVTNNTDFHWRHYLSPTPPFIYWLFTLLETVVMTINGHEIITNGKPWVILMLLILQTAIAKTVPFFGKIKDEYEKKQTVTIGNVPSDADITVTREMDPKP